MRPILKKSTTGRLLAKQEDRFTFCVSAENFDRDGDRVFQDGLDFKAFDSANSPAMLVHDTEKIPVGKWLPESRRIAMIVDPATGEKVKATLMDFVPNPHTREGREVGDSIRDDFIGAASISFLPKEDKSEKNSSGGSDYYAAEVTEISIVPVPANSSATRRAALLCKSLRSKAMFRTGDKVSVNGRTGRITGGQASTNIWTVQYDDGGSESVKGEKIGLLGRLGPASQGGTERSFKYFRHKTERRVRVLRKDFPGQDEQELARKFGGDEVEMMDGDSFDTDMAKEQENEWEEMEGPVEEKQAGVRYGILSGEFWLLTNGGWDSKQDSARTFGSRSEAQAALDSKRSQAKPNDRIQSGHVEAIMVDNAKTNHPGGPDSIEEKQGDELTPGEDMTRDAMQECVSRTIEEMARQGEDPQDQQTQAIAYSKCGEKALKAGVARKTLDRIRPHVLKGPYDPHNWRVGDDVPFHGVMCKIERVSSNGRSLTIRLPQGGTTVISTSEIDGGPAGARRSLRRSKANDAADATTDTTTPKGLEMLQKWHKAISDDLKSLHKAEHPHVIDAAKKSLGMMRKAAKKAYGEDLAFGESNGIMPDKDDPDLLEPEEESKEMTPVEVDGKWTIYDPTTDDYVGEFESEEAARRGITQEATAEVPSETQQQAKKLPRRKANLRRKGLTKAATSCIKDATEVLDDLATGSDMPKRYKGSVAGVSSSLKGLLAKDEPPEEIMSKAEEEEVQELAKAMINRLDDVDSQMFRFFGQQYRKN
jgi:phage head maturation protease